MLKMTQNTAQSDPNDLPHKPADDSEIIYYEGSPQLRGNLGQLITCWFFTLILIAAPIVIRIYQPDWPLTWIALACVLLALILLIVPPLASRRVRYRITNYRIDYERGLLGKRIDTLELWHVEDISFQQSLLDRLLKVGKITILSHDDTSPRLELHGLPNPRPIFDSLKQRIIAVKRQRGVIKVDSGA